MTAGLFFLLALQQQQPIKQHISGGPLRLEQACYDVQSYEIDITVDPVTKSIKGRTIINAKMVIPSAYVFVDLDDNYELTRAYEGDSPVREEFVPGGVRLQLRESKQPGDTIRLDLTYQGVPHVARNAPWDGGFMWSKTPSGEDWISVALQGAGADLLFPCKDHPSDRANEATMRITVPERLMAVGPGNLRKSITNPDKTKTYEWHMPLPINNYSLVFNAGPYFMQTDSVKSIGGQDVTIMAYVLRESIDKVEKLIEEQKKYFHFMEKYCGPFPFRTVKVGIVETPHLGMEHSTAIAYGNKFRFDEDGLDWLLLHEFGHEWWANLVSNSDWRDMWIHEGFQSFLDTFYIEQTRGKPAYFEAMKRRRRAIRNTAPVAPKEETSSAAYGGDIYDKGALILHSLRYLLGDEVFLKCIRRMAYPTKESETWTDGRAMRLVTSDDFMMICNQETQQDLRWFFDMYLRQPKLPKLVVTEEPGKLNLKWELPEGLTHFPMPVDVQIDRMRHRVVVNKTATIELPEGAQYQIDPLGWVLRQ